VKKAERVQFIHKTLNKLFPSPPIPLKHKDPYTLLIAVLLSAQCTDARVNTITPLLFKKADSPAEMIKLSIDEIEDTIRPCGLAPSKAKAIWNLSEDILTKHAGEVPQTFEELEAFPGVGHKTASVVMAQAFNVPAFPVDTHIHRLAKRWGLSRARNVVETEKDLKRLFPKEDWNSLHLQIIYFARKYCPAKGHDLKTCPICSKVNTPSAKAEGFSQAKLSPDRGTFCG
jgi:endonuclease-3